MILFDLTWIVPGYALWKGQAAGAVKDDKPGGTPAQRRAKKLRKGYHEVLEK